MTFPGNENDSIWTKSSEGTYVTEASTISATTDGSVSCPVCGESVGKHEWGEIRNDGETLGWSAACSHCGTKMTVFND